MFTQKLHAHFTYALSFRKYNFSFVVVLDKKAQETSASWNYTFLGYTPIFFWGGGELTSAHVARKTPDNHTQVSFVST